MLINDKRLIKNFIKSWNKFPTFIVYFFCFSPYLFAQLPDSTLPLNDLGTGYYKNFQGGLYPNGSNNIPSVHLADGLSFSNSVIALDTNGIQSITGNIVLLSIGMSNATQEFSVFKAIADTFRLKNPILKIIDGAQGGQTASIITDPKANFWTVVNQRLSQAGSSPKQVQVCWLKEANANPKDAFPIHAQIMQSQLETIVRNLKVAYPNLKIIYLSSRTYGGYATTQLNPEPYAYETAFAVKWLIEKQIAGDSSLFYKGLKINAPWLAWGPYLWANGTNPRSDGLAWLKTDFVTSDYTHPSNDGRLKVANLLLNFFSNDSTSKGWFLKNETSYVEKSVKSEGLNLRADILNQSIEFNLPRQSYVRIELWDLLGARGNVVFDGMLDAGMNNIPYRESESLSGIELIILKLNNEVHVMKILL